MIQNEPMTDAEIRSLLGATLHGPLPWPTVLRLMVTVAEVPSLRSSLAATEARVKALEGALEFARDLNAQLPNWPAERTLAEVRDRARAALRPAGEAKP